MRLLNKINSQANQRFFLTGNPGPRIVMNLRYLPTQQIWMMDLERDGWEARGIMVVGSPNILRAFKNEIPFGIACRTDNGLDPYFVDQFQNGTAQLYLLTADEVEQVEARFFQ